MAEDDKYPQSTGRRRFVKGVVGSASLAGIGTGAATALNSATAPSGSGGGITEYMAMENTAGPAPRGMPQVPIEIDSEGYLKGVWPEVKEKTQQGRTIKVAETNMGGVTYSSEWFQYCGVQTYPGVAPEADQDNFLRYVGNSKFEWQNETVEKGQKVHIDDFKDYESWGNGIGSSGVGKPALATWRSQDVPPANTMVVQVIRSTNVEKMAKQDEWINASTEKGFIGNLNKCTHFCCVPSFKGLAGSAGSGAEDMIYCQCHQSVYDPFNVIKKSFVALPRPESE
ncbi:ubiquinol-cytochrome c reductase iron-sulfur subunit [Halorussus halophilus]|uniref:ubiquinol-cytochrome c reductase iron-sulfur subunit n=1 Tax=Halorussus halophilus TaxID=2650975 RepID=UPI001300E2A5|nr:ubiquinol-cytochrome c reductase iron-sulfur subunit [Halorussus halophilus]